MRGRPETKSGRRLPRGRASEIYHKVRAIGELQCQLSKQTWYRLKNCLFSDEVDQVDLPGLEGDFGVLAGHTPIVAALRPGIIVIRTADTRQRFVVLGGLAEFSKRGTHYSCGHCLIQLRSLILPTSWPASIKCRIILAKISIGEELDRAIEQLDHYKAVHRSLTPDHGPLAVGNRFDRRTSFSATVRPAAPKILTARRMGGAKRYPSIAGVRR